MVDPRFIDHGIPAPADESRSAALCLHPDGRQRLVIAARGWALVVDPQSGACTQLPFPEGLVEYPFTSLSSRDGLFYTGAGPLFLVLDPFALTWRFCGRPAEGEEIAAFSLAEAPDGTIYGASYPHCHLYRFDQATNRFEEFGSMDEQQKYPFHLAADTEGWVYLGIGTEQMNLVGYCPSTGERRQLLPEEARVKGTGHVHRGLDDLVYAHFGQGWLRLHGGGALPVAEGAVSPPTYTGSGYSRIYGSFGSGLELVALDLPGHEAQFREPASGRTWRVGLAYESQGAQLAPMVGGPDGKLYGTSMHPLQLYTYDPATERLQNWGGQVALGGGGGNICAWAVQGATLAGSAYPGGRFHLLETTRPIGPGKPRLAASHEEIHRPRCALAHPDGRHVIWGGFAGYGQVGGGLAIYDLGSGQDQLLPNAALLPDHSTLSLGALPGGDLIGGTSVLAPGGAQPRAHEGELYRLDWATRRVLWRCVPVAGAREIALLAVDERGLVHALTGDSLYFVFDPESQRVLGRQDLQGYGPVVRDGLRAGLDGQLYALLRQGIFTLDPNRFTATLLAAPPVPITSGMAILQGRLYFGSGSHLWSYTLPTEERP